MPVLLLKHSRPDTDSFSTCNTPKKLGALLREVFSSFRSSFYLGKTSSVLAAVQGQRGRESGEGAAHHRGFVGVIPGSSVAYCGGEKASGGKFSGRVCGFVGSKVRPFFAAVDLGLSASSRVRPDFVATARFRPRPMPDPMPPFLPRESYPHVSDGAFRQTHLSRTCHDL